MTLTKLRVFIDADVLFAGAASPSAYSASQIVLRMAELTLIKAVTSEYVIAEAGRNLEQKQPAALENFHEMLERCLTVVVDVASEELGMYESHADSKDIPVLAAAIHASCAYLLTFNIRHFEPDAHMITVLRPGDFVRGVRTLLASQLGL